MSEPTKWDWEASNGNATAEETAAAYTALTSGGQTKAFTAAVWNDIIDKISEQREAWRGKEWDDSILSLDDSKLSAGGNMLATKFNSAVANIWPIESWAWEETLGRSTIYKGDRCYGAYFLYLTVGLNRWIEELTPLFLELELQSTLEITPNFHFCIALPLYINLKSTLEMTYKPALYSALTTQILLSIKDTSQVAVYAFGACLIDIPLKMKVDMQSFIKECTAASLRAINFIQSKIKINAECKTAVPFDVINNIVCNMKGTVLTGDLAYTAVSLDFSSSLTVNMETPDTLFLNADLQSILDGSCSLINPDCVRFAFDLGGLFQSTATLELPQAISTGIELQGVWSKALRAYECWAEYISRIELYWTATIKAYALAASTAYLSFRLASNLSVTVASLLATATYLSGNIAVTDETTVSSTLCQVLHTGFSLDAQTEHQLTVINGTPAYISTDIEATADIKAGVVLMPVAKVDVPLNMKTDISVYVRFAEEELVLASEIDDVLVSELDEQTVKAVEIKLT